MKKREKEWLKEKERESVDKEVRESEIEHVHNFKTSLILMLCSEKKIPYWNSSL